MCCVWRSHRLAAYWPVYLRSHYQKWLLGIAGLGQPFSGLVYYHRNDLENALRHARLTFDHRYYHPSANVDSAFLLTMILQAAGKPQEARDMLQEAMNYAVEMHSPTFRIHGAVLSSRARRFAGSGPRNGPLGREAYENLYLTPMVSFAASPLTIPKVLLAADTAGRP